MPKQLHCEHFLFTYKGEIQDEIFRLNLQKEEVSTSISLLSKTPTNRRVQDHLTDLRRRLWVLAGILRRKQEIFDALEAAAQILFPLEAKENTLSLDDIVAKL
jgi:hypothetical protein